MLLRPLTVCSQYLSLVHNESEAIPICEWFLSGVAIENIFDTPEAQTGGDKRQRKEFCLLV